ncbi:hypothetical protein Bca52824_076696 [Brassica carinata]|uniref:Bet v I/Major latex protein domain-containing protein n=1 Tax=Brassica carinata TaxID=52824 RepID=A0A8X7TWX7_BRACI|nr:hypothetical protein Bca52824_076696 [Brassica carinata]
MAKYKSSGKLDLESPAVEFIEHLTRKKNHVSFFFAAVDLRFEVEPKDSETRAVTMSIHGNLTESYKTIKATFTVAPGEDMAASCLAYTFEFEKISHNIEDKKIVESLLTYISLSDVSYKRKFKHNSIDTGYPAEKYFKDFVNAFENDDEVEMGGVDWQKRTFTVSFISAPSMMENFETIKVTITIIPKKEGSRVKWSIEVENIDDDTQEPDSFLFIACSIRETIQSKFAATAPPRRHGQKKPSKKPLPSHNSPSPKKSSVQPKVSVPPIEDLVPALDAAAVLVLPSASLGNSDCEVTPSPSLPAELDVQQGLVSDADPPISQTLATVSCDVPVAKEGITILVAPTSAGKFSNVPTSDSEQPEPPAPSSEQATVYTSAPKQLEAPSSSSASEQTKAPSSSPEQAKALEIN